MKRVVLDASAMMAFFEGRTGADKVEQLINQAVEGKRELLMSVVNWGEVYYSIWHERGREEAERVLAEIAQLPIEIVDAGLELTKLAAEFKAQHKLPYADGFAAALARQSKAALLTTDKDFAEVGKQVSILWVGEPRGD